MIGNLPAVISLATFIAVMALIVSEKLHLTVAAFLGALILIFTHVITLKEGIDYISQSYSTLALFFGVMVLVRTFEPTRVFEYLATQMVLLARGNGKLLLLGIIAIVTPICAVLPNATTVMLLAPLIPPLAVEIGVDFVPLIILMVFTANSAGLLTLVGDPATFIVGTAINLNFGEYLFRLSFMGMLAIAVVVLMAPFLFRKVWRTRFTHLQELPHPKINHPRALVAGGIIITIVLVFFVIGESLPVPIGPASVALLGAGLSLFLAEKSKLDTVPNILRDVDWSTLIFFMSVFAIIGALEKTGVTAKLADLLAFAVGSNILLGSIILVIVVGILSSFVPNIPLVVAMLPLLKQYVVNIGLAGPEILSPTFNGQFPTEVLPLFYAMMFGATLGGNGTLVGASSNIVAAGIAEQHGQPISFHRFLGYGLPVMAGQLVVAVLFVIFLFFNN